MPKYCSRTHQASHDDPLACGRFKVVNTTQRNRKAAQCHKGIALGLSCVSHQFDGWQKNMKAWYINLIIKCNYFTRCCHRESWVGIKSDRHVRHCRGEKVGNRGQSCDCYEDDDLLLWWQWMMFDVLYLMYDSMIHDLQKMKQKLNLKPPYLRALHTGGFHFDFLKS